MVVPNPNWPKTVTQFQTTDPFGTGAPGSWVDISNRIRTLRSAYGRQYELDVIQAGEAQLLADDEDEYLNPTNTGSPYYPNVKLYRKIADQAMWPPQPSGSAVNLLNSNSGYDPTFESYAVGASVTWATSISSSWRAQISSAAPFAGTKSMSVSTHSDPYGLSFAVACIPGQQYTFSAYVCDATGNTVTVSVQGGVTGSSGTPTTYTRMSVTFTATATAHNLLVQASNPGGLINTLYVDNIQLELGGSVSAFATSGPAIYNVFNGYVERWPSQWLYQGTFGQTPLVAVDALAILANRPLHTEYTNSILAKKPDYYWRLNDGATATSWVETSGNNGPPLTRWDAKDGPATVFAPGTSIAITGDPSSVGLKINGSGNTYATSTQPNNSVIQTGMRNTRTQGITMGTSAFPVNMTIALWFQYDPLPNALSAGRLMRLGSSKTSHTIDIGWSNSVGSGEQVTVGWYPPVGTSVTTASNAAHGKPHLLVATLTASAGVGVNVTTWVDGAAVGSTNAGTDWAGPYTLDQIQVGALISDMTGYAVQPGPPNGIYAHVALWNRALTSGEINDLYQAAGGYLGENSGTRISRYLSYGWSGPSAIDQGMSTMGVSPVNDSTLLLSACQDVAITESGRFWADTNGNPTFQSRQGQYLNTTPKWVFGEQESPYDNGIQFDYDPTLLFNTVKVTQVGGSTVTGGAPADVAASVSAYGVHSYSRSVNTASANEAQDAANWIFLGHRDPHQRVSAVTVTPSANPALWPVALGARLGDRVTLKRRTSAGYTMSSDYFIERVEHNRSASQWTVKFQMSPISATTMQPWLLEDPTYGVLDSTTLLAY